MAGAKLETSTLSLARYAPDAKAWIVAAQALADERGHAEVSPLHLLVRGIDGHPGVKEAFRLARVDVVDLATLAERALGTAERAAEPSYLSARTLELLRRVERDADRENSPEVTPVHVLRALAQEVRGPAGEVLGAFGIGPGSLDPHMGALRKAGKGAAFAPPKGAPGSAETRDLVALAGSLDPVVGRKSELSRLLTILERREKCHPLLVGEPGVGKSAIVRGLAAAIARGDVPKRLAGARLIEVDVGHLLSGARVRSEVDGRLGRLVAEAAGTSDPILFLPSLEQLFGQGTLSSTTGDALRSAMERGAIRLLGTTTSEGVRRLADRDANLLRELTLLDVAEPSPAEAVEIVRGLSPRFEEHHAVTIAASAVEACVLLAKRYLSDRFLPGSALDLLDESAAALRVLVDASERGGGATASSGVTLTGDHVAHRLGEWTGIPVARMLEAEADKLLRMEERLERRVVGQTEGVKALSRAVRRGRVGLRDPRRPIGSFLFLGPSGVGKTELAKALAEFLFDDEAALTRLDMSEFMERHMAQRLLGAPPGYADSEQGGFLTEAVRRRPYSVLLFDEVEKAHGDVFNLLLQVLDDGRLTDGRGRLADFTNTVVILTSNIGSERILDADPKLFESQEGREALKDVLQDQLGKFFRPEFLNRIDDVIVFRALSRADLRRIVDIQLAGVSRLLEPRRVALDVDEAAKNLLVDLGYQPALGARPLRRAILKHVQDPLAEKLLEAQAVEGATVTVRASEGALSLAVVPPDP